jgi:hypothetical protein
MAQTKRVPRYVIARSMIVTANADGSVPLNSRVLATVGRDDDQAECHEMLARANAHDDLVSEARSAMRELEEVAPLLTGTGPHHGNVRAQIARLKAVLAKAGA